MRITLLGTFELRTDDDRTVPVATRKRREVLAALALDLNRVVPTDALLRAVWGPEPPPAARSALQGHIAQLRKELDDGMRLVTRPPGYVLLADESSVDVHRFTALVRRGVAADRDGAVEPLRAALAEWRGPALSGLGGERLGEWAAELHQTRLVALEALGGHLVDVGRGPELLAALREAMRGQPFRESLVRLVMLALYQDGQQAEALAVYHRTRGQLADELGVDPGAALRTAYEAILRGEACAAPARRPEPSTMDAVPAQLPGPPRGFVGRDDELAASAAAGDVTLVTGPAGIGKTALALRWAHGVAADHPDGALFADLRGSAEPVRPAAVLGGFLTALGVPVPDGGVDVLAATYRSALAGRRMLVVLDDAAATDQVRPLLPAGPGHTVVVTSRCRLDSLVAGEGARAVSLGALPDGAARALLAAALGEARVGCEPAAVRRVLDACDGLPLALRVAAARLAARPADPLAGFAARLADEEERLAALRTTDGSAGVVAALAGTHRRLPDHAAYLLRCLGAHPDADITPAGAAELSGLAPTDARRALEALDTYHLLTELADGSYRRTALVRLYSRELLAGQGPRRVVDADPVPGAGPEPARGASVATLPAVRRVQLAGS